MKYGIQMAPPGPPHVNLSNHCNSSDFQLEKIIYQRKLVNFTETINDD